MDKFDDVRLDDSLAAECREVATRIRLWRTTNAIEIGRELSRMKEKLDHGHFMRWITTECYLNVRTAQNYMSAARWIDAKGENVSHLASLPLSIVYELAADDVPEDAEVEVLAVFESGERLTAEQVKERITSARNEDAEADALADGFIEDLSADVVTRRQQRRAINRVLVSLLVDWTQEERATLIEQLGAIGEKGDALTSIGEAANA